MTPQEMEFLVRQRVAGVRAGRMVEDDRVELKSEWPDDQVKAARQLGGFANRAAGQPLVLVKGVDEKSGAIRNDGQMDVGDWWASLQRRFDQRTSPRLVRHQQVWIEEDEFVTALLFDTSEAPYVVTLPSGDRDVPMRAGSNTRSAHRHELVDMLVPHRPIPRVTVLAGDLQGHYHATLDGEKVMEDPENPLHFTVVSGLLSLYLEQPAEFPVTLIAHRFRARLRHGAFSHDLEAFTAGVSKDRQVDASRWGVHVLGLGRDVLVSGGGALDLHLKATWPHTDARHEVALLDDLEIDVMLPVAAARDVVRFTIVLPRVKGSEDQVSDGRTISQNLGAWSHVAPMGDGW